MTIKGMTGIALDYFPPKSASYLCQFQLMKAKEPSEIYGPVYREYSRQKYNKYKHQFPRWRESEIVAKIIREWDAMPNTQKRGLVEKYKDLEAKNANDDSPLSQAYKGYNVQEGPTPTPPQRKAMITPPSKLNQRKREESQEGRESERHSDRMSMRSSVSNGISSSRHKKKKNKRGSLGSNYVTFYRHNFSKLSWEHPRWEAAQINQIIRLLWHKQKQEKKVQLLPVPSKPIRKVSGRTLFTREKRRVGYDTITIHKIWSQLTHESKVGFSLRGAGKEGAPLFPHNVVTLEPDCPSPITIDSDSGLGFMHRTIDE